MKYFVLIPDGAADEPQESLGGKTPLAAASTPMLQRLAKHGRTYKSRARFTSSRVGSGVHEFAGI